MSETSPQQPSPPSGTPKSNKIVLAIIAIIVIAVLVYAFVGQSDQSTSSDGTPITMEQLLGEWNQTAENGDIHYFCFEQDGTFIYTVTPQGKTSPTIAAIRTKYTLNQGALSVDYTIDMEAFNEAYTAMLNNGNLVLSAAKEGSTRFCGCFTPITYEEDGITSSSTTSPNSSPSPSGSSSSTDTLTQAVDAYLRYIDSRPNYPDYKLLYLDGDNIPELYLMGSCEADASYLVTFANGKINEHPFGRIGGLTYVEKSGKYQYYNGHMGFFSLEQGTLSQGVFQTTTKGTQEELYNATSDALYYQYNLNGQTVDSLTYEKQLNDWLAGGYIMYGSENCVNKQTLVNQLANLQ